MKRFVVALGVLFAAGNAHAGDTFGIGDKHSGDLDLSACNGTRYVNEYTTLSASGVSVDGFTLNVTSAANFLAGDVVMVWQPAAMAPGGVTKNGTAEFAFTGTTGQYELARVFSKTATTLVVTTPMVQRSFTPLKTQVVRVPEFRGVNVAATCTIAPGSAIANAAQPWDGATGGIVAFLSDDTGSAIGPTTINGHISADAAGFQGVGVQSANTSTGCGSNDDLPVASGGSNRGENITSSSFPTDVGTGVGNLGNGGGGGNCSQSGGGGGGNAGVGGNGGLGNGSTLGGRGGAPLAWRNLELNVNGSLLTRLTLGGAGGRGQLKTSAAEGSVGASGGGVIFIRAKQLLGTGFVHANGGSSGPAPSPAAEGQGGGGSGGEVVIRLEGTLAVPCANIQVKGGNGGGTPSNNVGGGGGGSGGRLLVESATACTTGVSTVAAGGNGGVSGGPNGQPGDDGTRETVPGTTNPGGVFCPDSTAGSETLCLGANATKPHCNFAFNFCAECGTNAHCSGDPIRPACDTTNGICTCTANSDCPGATPFCNVAGGKCEAKCDTNGGDTVCSHFGNTPGATRFCETTGPKKGQCVQCVSTTNSECPITTPVCTSTDTCATCDVATAAACADHGSLVCNPTDGVPPGDGSCVQCLTAANCTGTNGCVSFTCTACNSDPSCSGSPSGPRCNSGNCVECLDANDCTPGQGCVSNACGACVGNGSCTNSTVGPICVGGSCVQCADAGDCAAGQGCVGNVCTACTSNGTCTGSAVGPFCVTGSCVECRNAADCSAGQGCATNVCGSCGASDANCTGSTVGPKCNATVCVECLANTDCGNVAKPQCTTNACVACNADAGCTGHAKTLCETVNAGTPALVGTCVDCKSNNGSFDCKTNAAPQCDSTTGTCTTCAGATGDTACQTNHGGRRCEENNTPPSLNGTCVICRGERSLATTDCTSAVPLCDATNDTCGPCDTNGSTQCVKFGAAFVCDNPSVSSDAGVAGTGACVGCVTDDDCGDTTIPHCVAKSCVGCDDGTPNHGDEACTHFDGGVPACQPGDNVASNPGQCHQCSFFNRSQCTGATPSCNFVSGACQLCTVVNGDMGSQSTGCAANAAGHACQGAGAIVFCGCTTDADCGSATSGRICDQISHLCKNGCSRAIGRNDCPASQFCSSNDGSGNVTGVCTMNCQFDADCTMAGVPFCIGVSHNDAGADAGTMGRCVSCRTDGDCSGGTPVCEPTLKVCVECTNARLDLCTAAGSGAICLANETCGCAADSDCGAADSGRICDLVTTHECITGCRVAGGNGCPSGLICDGAGLLPGHCVVYTDMAMNIPDASEQDLSVQLDMAQNNNNFRLSGGGIGCNVGGTGDVSLAALLLLALAALGLRRRVR